MYLVELFFLAITFIEAFTSELPETDLFMDELPFSKSLGFNLGKRLGRTLDDAQLDKEFKELYQDMMKTSEEVDKTEDLDKYISHIDLTRLKNSSNRRSVIRSPAITRRARSQSLRRQKLNSQGLRSHLQHSRQTNSNADLDLDE